MSALRTGMALRPASLSPSLASAARRSFASSRSLKAASAAPFFPNEPEGPSMKTAIPGPKTKKHIDELNDVFDTRSMNMLADYTKSVGNYIVDPDDNTLLDV